MNHRRCTTRTMCHTDVVPCGLDVMPLCFRDGIGPPLNKTLFPVQRPSGLKRANWNFFFIFGKKKKFYFPPMYILVYKKMKSGKKKKFRPPGRPGGFFWSHPVDRKQTCFNRLAKHGLLTVHRCMIIYTRDFLSWCF